MRGKANRRAKRNKTDTSDEPNSEPTVSEPVSSTAGEDIQIGVKQKPISRSKKNAKISFENNKNEALESPFYTDGLSTSSSTTKGPEKNDEEAPSPEKANVPSEKTSGKDEKEESKSSPDEKEFEIDADVLRISEIYEKTQWRMVLRDVDTTLLVPATCCYEYGKKMKVGDRIHVEVVSKRDEFDKMAEIHITKIDRIEHNGAGKTVREHLISDEPFCIIPKFINELSDRKLKTAFLHITIVDIEEVHNYFSRSSGSEHATENQNNATENGGSRECEHSKSREDFDYYCRVRVMDLSGQLLLFVPQNVMEKLLQQFELSLQDWIENITRYGPSYKEFLIFPPYMVEIKRTGKDDWECTDIELVNWYAFGAFLKEKERIMGQQIDS
ncbi:unnamed protein product [Caenorhabditis brenneri]